MGFLIMIPVYVLIRTSRRPEFFRVCMESVFSQTYKNIVTIVHTDDPRDKYAKGDITIQGSCYGSEYGTAPYNLYCNKLLDAIPEGEGWYHFLDDDDMYASNDVIEKLVKLSKRDYMNVAHVKRWGNKIMPPEWGDTRKGFQTECFFLHTDHKNKARWWGNKNGDGNYSLKLLKTMPVNWIENLIICKAQEGKGHGNRADLKNITPNDNIFKPDEKVVILVLRPYRNGLRRDWLVQGEKKWIEYGKAVELEKKGFAKITNYDKDCIVKAIPRRMYSI
jgi:hypothetical protein